MVNEKRPRASSHDHGPTSTLLSFLTTVAHTISARDENDVILKCECDHLDQLEDRADELFDLADQKLHVFPFKETVRLVRTSLAKQVDKATHSNGWIQEAVSMLDMTIIMAGALAREKLVAEIFARLQQYASSTEPVNKEKRRRQETTRTRSRPTILPPQRVSIPTLNSPVGQLRYPSTARFSQWMETRQPVLLLEIMGEWSAVQQWSMTSYWLNQTFGGRRLVPIETGRSYVDDGWGQKIIPFGEFLDKHICNEASTESDRGYLAQHDLFRQLPALSAAVITPEYCHLDAPDPEPNTPLATNSVALEPNKSVGKYSILRKDTENGKADDREVKRNIWFGPAWTITPLHHDPYHNVLCQVVGTKYVRLFSPHSSTKLQPMSNAEAAPHLSSDSDLNMTATIDMSNTSHIDIAAMELSPHEDWDAVYPGISDVPYQECLLEAGQALYIPIGWWHYVRSCSVGISVSFWWGKGSPQR